MKFLCPRSISLFRLPFASYCKHIFVTTFHLKRVLMRRFLFSYSVKRASKLSRAFRSSEKQWLDSLQDFDEVEVKPSSALTTVSIFAISHFSSDYFAISTRLL